MKKISPRVHGYIDYFTVAVFLLAPMAVGLTGVSAMLAYTLAGVHLLMTLMTDFPLGVVKLIPFAVHGWVERAVGPLLVLVPFVPPVAADAPAQIFYVLIGIVIILVGLLTDYRQ